MIQFRKGLVKTLTHFLALKGTACSKNRDLAKHIEYVYCDRCSTLLEGQESGIVVDEVLDLALDLRDIHAEILHRQA